MKSSNVVYHLLRKINFTKMKHIMKFNESVENETLITDFIQLINTDENIVISNLHSLFQFLTHKYLCFLFNIYTKLKYEDER